MQWLQRSVGLAIIGSAALGAGALWVAIANPMMVINMIGGGHNDLLVVGFLAAGALFALRDRPAVGIGLVTCAMAVKASAGLALPFIVLVWAAQMSGSRWVRIAKAAAAGVGVYLFMFDVYTPRENGSNQPAIATLLTASGQVQRKPAQSYLWSPAGAGTKFYLNDAVQTGPDAKATLRLTDGGRDRAQHERLREQLRDDARARRADRAAHHQLGFAGRSAREHQQADGRADDDEQHHREDLDRAEDEAERLVLRKVARVLRHVRPEVLVRVRLRGRETTTDDVELRLRAL